MIRSTSVPSTYGCRCSTSINYALKRSTDKYNNHYLKPPILATTSIARYQQPWHFVTFGIFLVSITISQCDSFFIARVSPTYHHRGSCSRSSIHLRSNTNTYKMMDNSNIHLDQNNHKDDDDDDDDDKYAFPCNVVDLELPDPPMDASPMYITTATTATNTGDTIDTKDDDNNEMSKDKPPRVLYKVPTRFNYVTSNTTKVIIQRDVHGNDYSIAANDNNNDDDDDGSTNGIGWFTNHRTIYVENGRINRYTLHANGFELIPLLKDEDDNDKVSLRSSFPDPTTTKSLTDIDFTNRNDVLKYYYPYCQQLLQQVLLERYGDQVQVWAFDHNVRIQPLASSSPQQGKEEVVTEQTTSQTDDTATSTKTATTVIQKPIGLVHGDYTTISAPRRLQLLSEPPKINDVYYEQFQMLYNNDKSTHDDCINNTKPQKSLLDPNLVQECLSSSSSSSPPGDDTTSPRRRYAFINVWKNIDPHHPVMALPLGCVDATTVSMDDDLRTLELHYTDRIGENYLVCRPTISQSPQHERREHQWVYYPQMTHNEVLLIKQWDSAGTDITSTNKTHKKEEYVSTMAIHSAFIDPTTPPNNTIRRQSIEVRCVAIWV